MPLMMRQNGMYRLLARLKKKNETISQVVDIVEKKVVDFWAIMTDNSIQEVGGTGRRRENVNRYCSTNQAAIILGFKPPSSRMPGRVDS